METILTILAEDKPGIVERLAQVIETLGGNWLESRLAVVAHTFIGIIRIRVQNAIGSNLEQAFAHLEAEGIYVTLNRQHRSVVDKERYRIDVIGNDRPGIVREVAVLLSSQGVNVIDVRTEVTTASMSGCILFMAKIEIEVDQREQMKQVISALEQLSHDLMVDCALVEQL